MKKTILVVDDDASVRESVKKVLGGADYEAVLAAGAWEAVARIQSNKIDLVLLDIGLANQSGWETCRHLAREHSNAPIIVITGQAGQLKSALAAGAAGLMEKPLDAQQLLQMIQLLLARSRDPIRIGPTASFTMPPHDQRSSNANQSHTAAAAKTPEPAIPART